MLRSVSLNPAFLNASAGMNASKEAGAQNANQDFYLNLNTNPKKGIILEKINQLVENIGKIKTKIETELTIDNIKEYKDVVKSFLNFYVDNVLEYKDVLSRHPKYGYSQKMTVVKQIESGMNDAEDIVNLINTKTGHLEMLNKIGEIHGLILNLVL
ncbi:DUF327 family protein [Microbacteriaceae bacterium 4G12]